MPEIAPFRGLLYDPSHVDPARAIAPPYDVIDATERARLAALNPHNCVRLILPEGEGDAKYAAAAADLAAWRAAGVVRRDDQPALYVYHQIFTSAELGGRTVTRRGFVAAVRLHRFDERVILPHERTLAGPKIDRLKLMQATGCHFSQIFTLYSDPSGTVERALLTVDKRPADLDGTTGDGTRHLMWRLQDREVIGRIARVMAPLKLYIADGHHRYETMLALRDWMRERAGGDLSSHSAAEFGTLFLASMDDPGMIVLPTHRLVHNLAAHDKADLVERAGAHFDVTPLPGGATDAAALRAALKVRGAARPSFAVIAPGDADAAILSLRAGVDPARLGLEGPPALVELDVTLLHSLVLERLLGIDRAAQEAQRNIIYVKDTADALRRVAAGEAQLGFIMNPTKVSQVKAVADAKGVMPQKLTFFYPKIASGLVMNPIDPNEALG